MLSNFVFAMILIFLTSKTLKSISFSYIKGIYGAGELTQWIKCLLCYWLLKDYIATCSGEWTSMREGPYKISSHNFKGQKSSVISYFVCVLMYVYSCAVCVCQCHMCGAQRLTWMGGFLNHCLILWDSFLFFFFDFSLNMEVINSTRLAGLKILFSLPQGWNYSRNLPGCSGLDSGPHAYPSLSHLSSF